MFPKKFKKILKLNSLIFLIAILIGFITPYGNNLISNLFEDSISLIKDFSTLEIIFYLILSNIRAALMIVLFGFLFLSIPSLFINGFFVGSVFRSSGTNILSSIALIIPHGIFELPALILAASLGTLISMEWFSKNRDFRKVLKYSGKVFLRVIIPLLVIAGIIEGLLISLII